MKSDKNYAKIRVTQKYIEIKRHFCVASNSLLIYVFSVTNTRSGREIRRRIPIAAQTSQTWVQLNKKHILSSLKSQLRLIAEGKPDIDSDLYIIHNIQTEFSLNA